MKKIPLTILILLFLAFAKGDAKLNSTSVIVTPESSLLVRGSTNISSFTCKFDVGRLKNPIQVFYKNVGTRMVFDRTVLILDNHCFDCGGKGLNKDLQEILKTGEHPEIKLFLNEINDLDGQSDDMLCKLDIEIAGVTKNHEVPVKIRKNGELLITGDLTVSMSDYNLIAPKKLFGLIYVNDTIKIYFQLVVQENL